MKPGKLLYTNRRTILWQNDLWFNTDNEMCSLDKNEPMIYISERPGRIITNKIVKVLTKFGMFEIFKHQLQ
jgi:hypothetical protein